MSIAHEWWLARAVRGAVGRARNTASQAEPTESHLCTPRGCSSAARSSADLQGGHGLHEQQKSYCYITQEMIVLEQQLAKARHWAELVESIRGQEVQLRTIEQIYQDGKNMPVNFQELMNEVKARKTQAEQLDQRIKVEMALRRTRREANVGTTRKSGKRSANSNTPGVEEAANEDSQEGASGGQPDKEQIFRDLLEEARKAKL